MIPNNKIVTKCAVCFNKTQILKISLQRSIKKNGHYICASCKAKSRKHPPQCTKNFWTSNKRKNKHSQSIKNSQKYYESLKNRDTSKEKNGMYGRKHSSKTKLKMSIARIGKFGDKATAWKGGKLSLTRRIKGIQHTTFHWYEQIYKRDNYKCVKCFSKQKIDAHHIIPVWKLIKDLITNISFKDEEAKFLWLIKQPEIIDSELENGITLCRSCHKKEHLNWGSHYVI